MQLRLLLFSLLILLSAGVYGQCPGITLNISADNDFFCSTGGTVNFTNSSVGAPVGGSTFTWFVNGVQEGTTNGNASWSHDFSALGFGTHSVRVDVEDPTCPNLSRTFSVEIAPTPSASFSINEPLLCSRKDINFTNNSTNTTGNTTYNWDFGDGNSSSATNPTHTYTAVGNYNVTLTVSNGPGCSNTTIPQTVNVGETPIINISGSDISGDMQHCFTAGDPVANMDVDFVNYTTGAATHFWDFGDGNTSTDPAPTNNYGSFGVFDITYTATSADGCTATSDSYQYLFMERPKAEIDLINAQRDGCAPHTINLLENNSSNAVSYIWDFGNGTVNQAQNPIDPTPPTPPNRTYSGPGSYEIRLTAINECGQDAVIIGPIVVQDKPSTGFNISPNSNFCASTSNIVTITNTTSTTVFPAVVVGTGPTSQKYRWNFGHGDGIEDTLWTNAEATPPQTYSTQGSYTITLDAQNGCGTRSFSRTIRVDSIPVVSVIADNVNACSAQTVSFTNNTINNHPSTSHYWSWTARYPNRCYTTCYGGGCCGWENGSGSQSSRDLSDKTFNFPPAADSVPGQVYYRASNHCGTRDTTITIITHRPTAANFLIPSSVCVGEPVTIDDRSLGERISFAPKPDTLLVYSWDFGDGNTSNTLEGDTTYHYTTPGIKEIELAVRGYCGPDTIRRTIEVKPFPIADIGVVEDSLCISTGVVLTNNSTAPGAGVSHHWNFGGGISPNTSTAYLPGARNYTSAGTKRIVHTVTLNGCTSRDTVFARVFPNPIANFDIADPEGCSPFTLDAANLTNNSAFDFNHTYQWDYGDGTSSTGFDINANIYEALGDADSIHTIKLEITTEKGCVDSLKTDVTIRPIPVPAFDIADDEICRNVIPDLTNNSSTTATSYEWHFDIFGTSTDVEPEYIFPNNGNFDIKLIAISDYGCKDSVSHPIFIDQIPDAEFTATEVCQGVETTFDSDMSVADVAWTWYFDSHDTITGVKNPTFEFPVEGNHNTTLIVENIAGCTDTISQSINVKLVPKPQINAVDFCLEDLTAFESVNTTPASPITHWNWDFGDGTGTSVANDTLYEYLTTGIYDVKLIVENDVGCIDSTDLQVTITGIPTSDFDFISMCANDSISFTNLSTGDPGIDISYAWNFGNGASSNDTTPNYAYNGAATYNVSLTTEYIASGCFHVATKPVEVYPRTVPTFSPPAVCLNETTVFTDLSPTPGDNSEPNSWTWIFDTTNATVTSNAQNTTFDYTAPGDYVVQLITENTFGCVDTTTRTIRVNVLPVAGFDFDAVCLGNNTEVTDLSSGGQTWKYLWGDGTETHSNNSEPTHLYSTFNDFEVTQIVFTQYGCSDTLMQEVTVNPNPVAHFSASTACASYNTVFTDLSTDAEDWHWNFGDGSGTINDSTQHPLFTYPSEGNFNATLTVRNEFNCPHSVTRAIHVREQPQSDFNNNIVCAGNDILFENTSTGTGITGYVWNFGDGSPEEAATIADPDASNKYDIGGSYFVTLITSNTVGCKDTLERAIDVFNVPFPDFSAATVCVGTVTSFVNLTTDGSGLTNDYHWDFGDGNTSYQASPNYIYGNPGEYTVTLLAGNPNGCDSTIQKLIRVAEIPVADFLHDTVCHGVETNFSDVSTGIPNDWIWDFGDGTIVNSGNQITHTFGTQGNYLVSLRVSGGGQNCTDEVHKIITVNEVPKANAIIDDVTCLDQPISFQNASTMIKDSIVTYAWNMGDNTTYSTENGTHLYNADGNYTVQLVVTSSQGCQDATTGQVLVNPLPQTGLSTYPISHCPGETLVIESANDLIYEWTGPNNITHEGQTLTIDKVTMVNGGFYAVTVTDDNGCSFVDSVNVTILTGKDCMVITQLVTPNSDGNNDTWIIEGIDDYPNVVVNIFNRWGSLVYQNQQYANDWSGQVNKGIKLVPEGQVPSGTYFYTIDLNDGVTEEFNGFIELQY